MSQTTKVREKARSHGAADARVPADSDAALRDAGGRFGRVSNAIGFTTSIVGVVFAARKLSKARAKDDRLAVAEAAVGVAGVVIGLATRVRDARARRSEPRG